MKATKAVRGVLAGLTVLLLPHVALAVTWLELEPSQYPTEVRKLLAEVREACKEAGNEIVDYPQAGVTIVDLNRDGSKDIILEAWRACSVPLKGAGCNTA